MTPEIWTLEEVAKFLRVSDEAVESLVKEAKIPHFRVGDAIRFRKDHIMQWTEGGADDGASAFEPHSRSEYLKGRTEWRMSRDKRELFVILGNPHSSIAYSLIPLADSVRMFFPGYKSKFILETVAGDIETRVTSAPDGTPVGTAGKGRYIQGGLTDWFRIHKREIESGLCLRIGQIEKWKRYKLDLVSNEKAKSALAT